MHQSQLNWYVVYTKHRWEKKTADIMEKKGYESYCPLNKVARQWHDRKKTILQPVFTSYVFVKADPRQLSYIKEIAGVVNFVHWLGKPAVVREAEVQSIKDFLNEHPSVDLEKIAVNINDTVKITKGPFMHKQGTIIEVNNNTVKIEIPSIGYALVAKVSKASIELNNKPAAPAVSLHNNLKDKIAG